MAVVSETPAVSVVIPVYNGQRYLRFALDSILTQSFQHFEIVAVNDGSSDRTSAILADYSTRDSRVRVISNDSNIGRSASAAIGLSAARAPFVARMDADDVARPHRLERQLDFMHSHPDIDILGTFAELLDECGRLHGYRNVPTNHEAILRSLWANPIIQPSVMFRRDRIIAIGGYDRHRRYHDDYDLWFRCAAAGYRFANLPEHLVQYRVQSAQERKRRSIAWAVSHLTTGWSGCRAIRAHPLAYVGVVYPVARAMLPSAIARPLDVAISRLDPRLRSEGSKREPRIG